MESELGTTAWEHEISYVFDPTFSCSFEVLGKNKKNKKKKFIISNINDFKDILQQYCNWNIPSSGFKNLDVFQEKMPFFTALFMILSTSNKQKKLIRLKCITME